MIHKILQRKLKIEQHKPHKKLGLNSGVQNGIATQLNYRPMSDHI